MKKLYVVHGWGGSYTEGEGWFGYLKEKLPGMDFEVHGFDMPDTENPEIDAWVGLLEEKIKNLNEEVYFIGHSIGCQAILRFLEKLPENTKVGGAVFVAPWMHLDEKSIEEEEEGSIEVVKKWIETPIDFDKVKSHCDKFLAVFSSNDPYVPLSNKELFENNLGAKTIILENKEHFNQVSEIPEILEFLK